MEILCLSLFYYALLCVHSSAIILKSIFAIIVLRMYCYCKCSMVLPHGAMGWSAQCDCGIFLIIFTYFLVGLQYVSVVFSHSLLFFSLKMKLNYDYTLRL